MQCLMMRSESDLYQPWGKFLCLGLGLLYLKKQMAIEATHEVCAVTHHFCHPVHAGTSLPTSGVPCGKGPETSVSSCGISTVHSFVRAHRINDLVPSSSLLHQIWRCTAWQHPLACLSGPALSSCSPWPAPDIMAVMTAQLFVLPGGAHTGQQHGQLLWGGAGDLCICRHWQCAQDPADAGHGWGAH